MSKIFFIGLPRTGTTSACVALLDLGFKVAHSAYSERSIQASEVIGDTPAFCDYRNLDKRYPKSRFIYIERRMETWLPSIKYLLANMFVGLTMANGGFHPSVKRCYQDVFSPITRQSIASDAHLANCYKTHRKDVFKYFRFRKEFFTTIDLADEDAYQNMITFLGLDSARKGFPRMNANGHIISWQQLDHQNKIQADL